MIRKTLSLFAVSAAGLMLAACGEAQPSNGQTTGSATDTAGAVAGTAFGEMFKGDADAPVTLVEYASITCSHCRAFHADILPELQDEIDAGTLKFVFREFPTPPAEIAMAGFAIARCAGEDKYFDVLGDLFENQMGILTSAQQGRARTALETIGERHGLSKADFEACIQDDKLYASLVSTIEEGQKLGVNSTPSFFINGEPVNRSAYTKEGLEAAIREAAGIEAPAAEATTDTESSEASETSQ